MATVKKRKVDAECRVFQEKWTNDFFFVEVKGKPVCLVCGEALAVMKKANVERHYSSKHAKLDELKGQMRLDKINALRRSLGAQQAAFTRPQTDGENITRASFVVSELIATKLKPHAEGEFVKECLVAAAELLAPDKVKLFQSVSLSRRTVSERITDMAQDIEKTLKNTARDFEYFSLACDETTDITHTAQLAIFLRGITSEFETKEELLSLQAMHGTTKGEDLFNQVIVAMNNFELPFEKLSGIATDGAPAMVGAQKGLTALVKKEMSRLSLDPSDLVVCHCIIHQESLCAHSLKLNNVMTTVVSTINFIKSRGLNNRQFKELLSELESEYGDLVYHCEVRWLSRANMLARFYTLREEVRRFMEMKGKPAMELSDGKFLRDLAFMVDISKHLSELNIKLQGPNQLISSLLSNVKSFEVKLRLWQGQLERGNTVHFPTLQEQKPDVTTEYAGECAKLIQAFDERFHDVKNIQKELDVFATPFNVQPSDVPDNLQMEIIDLQNNNELKAKYHNLSLLDFYKLYVRAEDFPILRRHALKFASLFGTTYRCEQFFSKLTLAKNRFRSRLTDSNLENQLRVASSSLPADIRRLAREKQFQPSH
ncbi:general transcription factor II-I repeat domain-containing protein 2A-like [Gadus chalcogrammus]|uniref:general transcription factor II-I repeat domain-containing protein 2A-like n=1 Tax=Gadus chalcogrammus TaxID=1042646 RepID=UPI0024C4B9FB|nr:general transcription factor II-I repeat domain-containing protein 2A-like [Gadus chalcogrammus]